MSPVGRQFVDIQFYAEVGEISTDLNKRKQHEYDEVEGEQAERLLRRKVTAAFTSFMKKVSLLVVC
jgi:nucleosome binding factor SPN SPT16 subunit